MWAKAPALLCDVHTMTPAPPLRTQLVGAAAQVLEAAGGPEEVLEAAQEALGEL